MTAPPIAPGNLRRMMVDVMANRVHLARGGLRISGQANRAPSWAKAAYLRYGDGSARTFSFDAFRQLCDEAEDYVVNELGWTLEIEPYRRRWMRCPCGFNVRGGHPADYHEPGCALGEGR